MRNKRAAPRAPALRLPAWLEHLPDPAFVFDAGERLQGMNQRLQSLVAQPLQVGDPLARLADMLGLPASDGPGLVAAAAAQAAGGAGRPWRLRLQAGLPQGQTLVCLVDASELVRLQAQMGRTLRLASHDLRGPLASMMAVTGQLRREMDDRPSARQGLGQLEAQLQALQHTLDGLWHEIRAQGELHRVECLMDDLLEDALARLAEGDRNPGVALRLESAQDGHFVQVAPPLVVQALLALMRHAARAQGPGGIVPVLQRSGPGGDSVEVCVADASAGSGAEEAPAGPGLGLDFVRTVAERHGGGLHCEPAQAGGCVWVLSLPSVIDPG